MGLIYYMSSTIVLILISLFLSNPADDSKIKKELDIFYSAEKDTLRSLDVYWNDDMKNTEVIFFVHGGGWLSGDKKDYRNMAENLARHGFTVILANYRLSPKVKFPAHIEDISEAIIWAYNSAEKYNGDPEKIFLVGHSAGGHLVSLAVCDNQYMEKYNLSNNDIAGVITISGVFEIKIQEGGATRKYLGMVFGEDEEIWKNATCKIHIEKNEELPPFLITWTEGEGDIIKNESLNFIESLRNAGQNYQTYIFEGDNHNVFITALQDNKSNFSKKVMEFISGSEPQH